MIGVRMDTEGLLTRLSEFKTPLSEKVTGQLCRDHSIAYLNGLRNGTAWATKMWDSTAKLQTGLLTGNLNSLGNYDECINVRDIEAVTEDFSGQHCVATFKLENISATDAMGEVLKEVMAEEEEMNIGLGALLSKGLHWGFCIPSSCTSEDLTVSLSQHLGNESGVSVSVRDTDCYFAGEKPFTSIDWLAISIVAVLLCAVFASTGYEFLKEYMRKAGYWNVEIGPPGPPQSSDPVQPTVPQEEEEAEQLSRRRRRPGFIERTKNVVHMPCTCGLGTPPSSSRSSSPPPEPRPETLKLDKDLEAPPPDDVSPIREPPDYECDPWASFSLLSNGRKLFSFENEPASLQCLYGIKFLSICWVLIGHTCFITESLPSMNYVSIKYYSTKWVAMPILNASLAVDTFMVVTGVLISYNFLRDMKKRGIYRRSINNVSTTGLTTKFAFKYFPMYYCHRQIRLAPALAAMVLFQVCLRDRLGSGPFWESGLGYQTEVCRNHWWKTLLYLQNYINADKICLTHSWYLMVDMQLYIVSPLILLFLLAWNKRLSFITISLLVLMGITSSFLVNYFLELPAGIMSGDPSKWHLKYRFDYVTTHTRFAPWTIGIAIGYLLLCYRQKGKIELKMRPWIVFLGWTLTSLALLYAVFGVFPFQQPNYEYNALQSSLYSSVHHTIWALGIGWIIIACESNYGGIIKDILSWRIFQPLSRLTFCIYLVHLPLMIFRALMTRLPIHTNEVSAISSFFGDVLFSGLLAIVLSFLVEMPFIRLFKALTIKIGFPVRVILPVDTPRSLSQRVSILRELAIASYKVIASTLSSYRLLAFATSRTSQQAHAEAGPSQLETT